MIKSPRILPDMFQILPLTQDIDYIIIKTEHMFRPGKSMERRRYVSIWNRY